MRVARRSALSIRARRRRLGRVMVYDATVYCVRRLKGVPEASERLRDLLAGLVDPALHHPGCLQFQVHRRMNNPSEFLLVERWRSEMAFRRHEESPNVIAALERAAPCLELPAQVVLFKQVK